MLIQRFLNFSPKILILIIVKVLLFVSSLSYQTFMIQMQLIVKNNLKYYYRQLRATVNSPSFGFGFKQVIK